MKQLKPKKPRRRLSRAAALVLTAATAAQLLTSCTLASSLRSPTAAETAAPVHSAPAAGSPDVSAAAALEELQGVQVKGRAPKTGYSRDQFGQAWADTDHNGCDTRNDILARDLQGETFKPGTQNCVVLTGALDDLYTGKTILFERGGASEVDIDHRVPLSDAWQKGAQSWDEDTRTKFANDPINLIAVDAGANRQKGDSDLATWLPPNRDSWCGYTARIVHVKATYRLWMTQAEHDKASEILATCK